MEKSTEAEINQAMRSLRHALIQMTKENEEALDRIVELESRVDDLRLDGVVNTANDAIKEPPLPEPHRFEMMLKTNFSGRWAWDGPIDTIVLHHTAGFKARHAFNVWSDGTRQASAHYVIEREADSAIDTEPGSIMQCVPEDKAAWHAGNRIVNHRSIGIEIVHIDGQELTRAQDASLCWLILDIKKRHPITKITGHKWVSPGTTACPGDLWPSIVDLNEYLERRLLV